MILDCKSIATEIKAKVKEEVRSLGTTPILLIFQVGDDPASNSYIRGKTKDCDECGIKWAVKKYPLNVSVQTLRWAILNSSLELSPCSIILQRPVPVHLLRGNVEEAISWYEDVDGLTSFNVDERNKDALRPCTPLGIMELLHHYDIPIRGKHCVIIGRSDIVGKPLARMMLEEDATVTICHSKTENLAEITRSADILVSAVGKPKLITADMVKADCTVIDVGINRVDGKLCGDVDFQEVSKKVKHITPVPGGIGLLTRAMLMYNVVKSHRMQMQD